MPRPPSVPPLLRHVPFRGADAVARGLLSQAQLRAAAWRRLFPDVYVCADAVVDHLARCQGAACCCRPVAR